MFSKLKAYLTPNFSNHPFNWLLAPVIAFSLGFFPVHAFAENQSFYTGASNDPYINSAINGHVFDSAADLCAAAPDQGQVSSANGGYLGKASCTDAKIWYHWHNSSGAVSISNYRHITITTHTCDEPGTVYSESDVRYSRCPGLCEIPQGESQIFQGYAPSYQSCMSTSGAFGYQNCGMTIGSVSGSSDPVTCSNGPGTCFNEGLYLCTFTAYSTGEYSDADNHSWPDADTGTDPDDDANDGEGDDTDPEGEGDGTGETDTGGDNDQTGDGDSETGDGSDDTGGTGDDGDIGTDPDNDDGTGDSSGDGTGDSSGDGTGDSSGDPDDGTPDGNSNTGGASAGNGDGTGEGEEDGICSEPGMSEKLLCQEIVPPEVGEPGSFDLEALDDEIEQAWSDLSDVISATKADIKSTLSLSLSSGSGGLPCLGTFVFNGVTKEICLAPYAEELSKVSAAILFLCIIIGILIILR